METFSLTVLILTAIAVTIPFLYSLLAIFGDYRRYEPEPINRPTRKVN